MSHQSLYDEDILLWSEQQAEIIRRLGQRSRDLPNELDIANIAEEIESVGRSELASVESYLRLILLHLAKLAVDPGTPSARHWRSEIVAFDADMRGRYSPSMRQRIDVERIWDAARRQLMENAEEPDGLSHVLPKRVPLKMEELLESPVKITSLVERIRGAAAAQHSERSDRA